MKNKLFLLQILLVLIISGCGQKEIKDNYSVPSFIIDSHTHYGGTDAWEKSFLEIYTSYNAMACLLVDMDQLDRGIAFAKAHPDRVIPYAAIDIDSPTVVEIGRAHV